MNPSRKVATFLFILCATFWGGAMRFGFFSEIENLTIDKRFVARGPIESQQRIVYVNRDAFTTYAYGHYYFPRDLYAYVGDAVLSLGDAKSVFYDIIFSEYSYTSLQHLLDEPAWRRQNALLSQLAQSYPQKIVFAANYADQYTEWHWGKDTDWKDMSQIWDVASPGDTPLPEMPQYPLWNPDLGGEQSVDSWAIPGMINLSRSSAGEAEIRSIPPLVSFKNSHLGSWLAQQIIQWEAPFTNGESSFHESEDNDDWTGLITLGDSSIELNAEGRHIMFSAGLSAYLGSPNEWKVTHSKYKILLEHNSGGRVLNIPLNRMGELDINWYSPWLSLPETLEKGHESYLRDPYNPMISMQVVLEKYLEYMDAVNEGSDARASELKNWFHRIFNESIVLIGPTDPILLDFGRTPIDEDIVPRVSVHGNVIKMLADQRFIKRLDFVYELLILVLLTGVLLYAFGAGDAKTLYRKIIGILTLVSYPVFALALFSRFDLLLPVFWPLASAVSAGTGILAWKVGYVEAQRRRIRGLFGTYISPQLVNRIVDSKEEPQLGGHSQVITAFFSDIVAFTRTSESLKAEHLVEFINLYMDTMTPIIEATGGTLDKYNGDAIIAMFGAPYPLEDHPERACRAAIGMRDAQQNLSSRFHQLFPDYSQEMFNVRTRIGINTGSAVVGNMGSQKRFNYTMMGDSVNLASRAEHSGRYYGADLVVTANVIKRLPKDGDILFRVLDRVIVPGREQPEDLYELIGFRSLTSREVLNCVDLYSRGYAAYLESRWESAESFFEASLAFEPKLYGEDRSKTLSPSLTLLKRVRLYLSTGVPDDWKGAFRLPEK